MPDNALLQSIDKIKEFDLNLLLTFEAIFVHQSVTKAASLLRVSPSAVSQSLTKLRSFFSDPLFVREGQGLVATTVAENLHTHLSDGFRQLVNSLDYFSDSNTKSKFVIHSTAYAALRLLPEICSRIDNHAFNFEISHLSSDATLNSIEDVLIYRKADIIFDTRPYYSFSTITEPFIEDQVVAICRKDHPRVGALLTREDALIESSTVLNVGSDSIKKAQSEIEKVIGRRHFSFSSSSILANAAIIERTDRIGFVPQWFAEKFCNSLNLKILQCSFELSPVVFYMTFNKTALQNHSFIELLQVINESKPFY